MVSSFPYAIHWSREHVPSILHITQSSQELGNGLADIIFGKVSPAGRLVQTWPASIDELPPILDYNIRNGRTYMYDLHKPLFAFGHGLSYTTFEYSGLDLGQSSLVEGEVREINVDVKNTGSVDSDEVVQLYVRHPGSEVARPNLALKGFKRIHIPAGESRKVILRLHADELRYWNEAEHAFVLEKGEVEVMIGAASDNIRLKGKLETL